MATSKRKGGAPKGVQKTAKSKAKSKQKKQLTANQKEYQHQLNLLGKRIKSAREKGYIFPDYDFIPSTPNKIRQKDIQAIIELKQRKLWANAMWIDSDTGKPIPGLEGMHKMQKKAARKAQMTKQSKMPRDTYFDDPYEDAIDTAYDENIPDGGEIITDNFIDEFLSRLSTHIDPPYEPGHFGTRVKKLEKVYRARVNSQHHLITLTHSRINDEGKIAFGWRLQQSADILTDLIDSLLYKASTEEAIEMCTREIAEIVNGAALTMQDLMKLGEQDDNQQVWEPPV